MVDSRFRQGESHRQLLIVSFEQFGYHVDSFEYCRHLGDRFRVTYLCPDQGLPRLDLAEVEVQYLKQFPIGKVELGLLVAADRLLRQREFALAFLRRTKLAFLLRLCHPLTPMVFDVRSGSIEESWLRRHVEDGLLRANAAFFSHVTVISAGLAGQLCLSRKAHVLPLGAALQSPVEPIRDEMRLVYIGTFKNRYLERAVAGVGQFVRSTASELPVRFTVVGFGSDREREAIRNAAASAGIADQVEIRNRLDRANLPGLLAEHNVGVAFTPQVPWFEHQPSTKIFEYLQSGLLCIATNTAANREVISSANGVLVPATADGFRRGLEQLVGMLENWSPPDVAEEVRHHTWREIVDCNLAPYLEGIANR